MEKDIVEFVKGLKYVDYSKTLPTMEEIRAAEEKLGVKFADEYVQCLLNYGQLSVYSTELMGLYNLDGISDITHINYYKSNDVVHQTLELREMECHAHVPSNMYVIQNFCIDLLFAWQDETGAVYLTLPWSGPKKEADSLYEYIKMCYEEDMEDEEDYEDITDE